MVKNLPANSGDIRDMGLILQLGRSPGGGHGSLFPLISGFQISRENTFLSFISHLVGCILLYQPEQTDTTMINKVNSSVIPKSYSFSAPTSILGTLITID